MSSIGLKVSYNDVPLSDRLKRRNRGTRYMLTAATHQPQLGDREVVSAWTGVVLHLHITPRAFLPMEAFDQLTLVPGTAFEGDRYLIVGESGFY